MQTNNLKWRHSLYAIQTGINCVGVWSKKSLTETHGKIEIVSSDFLVALLTVEVSQDQDFKLNILTSSETKTYPPTSTGRHKLVADAKLYLKKHGY
jgi:hypothetical protein